MRYRLSLLMPVRTRHWWFITTLFPLIAGKYSLTASSPSSGSFYKSQDRLRGTGSQLLSRAVSLLEFLPYAGKFGSELMIGTFGPVATSFSICALTQSWRIVADPSNATEQQGREVSNPAWLTIVNALSLGIAVVTNLLMLMQMAEKIPYRVAAVFVIFGWWLSSALLLGLVAAAPSQLPLPSGQARTWSQAYYYAILAAAIYGVIGTMLAVTAYGVFRGRYATKFKLTTAQRTLMLQTMFFLGYVLAAAEVYSYIESWPYLDAGLCRKLPRAWSQY